MSRTGVPTEPYGGTKQPYGGEPYGGGPNKPYGGPYKTYGWAVNSRTGVYDYWVA